MAMLVTATVVVGCGRTERTVDPATRPTINALSTAVERFREDCGRLPKGFDELIAAPSEPKWKGPYLQGEVPFSIRDHWDEEIRYANRGDGYEIRSAGPDRTFDTLDDVTN